jgi:hypothetical protein
MTDQTTTETDDEPEGWNIGDTLPCGCEVVPVAVPCEFHERELGQAQTDCSDCEYGVPGVRHERNEACTGEDD